MERDQCSDDVEKCSEDPSETSITASTKGLGLYQWARHIVVEKLPTWGVEVRGIHPVPIELRTDKQLNKIFFIFFGGNINLLTFSTGTTASIVYGLGIRDACLLIVFFNLICSIPPAYLTTWGPKLGLRQICQARYSFGYYGVYIPAVLNLIAAAGFMVLTCILGGQTLSSASKGRLSWNIGIVIVAMISLLVSFCGYKVLNWYVRLAWIPVFVTLAVAVGIGGKDLGQHDTPDPVTIRQVLSFGSVLGGFIITYSPFSSDYTVYLDSKAPSIRVFLYSYFGMFIPITMNECLGAVFAVSAKSVPAWSAASTKSVGDLLVAVLSPAGGFGTFLVVLISFSMGNIASTMYSFCLTFQVLSPFFARLPRYVFSIVATILIIPLSIVASHRFYRTLADFMALMSYWSACFIAVVVTEHLLFRSGPRLGSSKDGPTAFEAYDINSWNQPSKLPLGVAALCASVLSFALVIPCMDQVLYIGPIARMTGDIGFEVALVLTATLYIPLRWMEKRVFFR